MQKNKILNLFISNGKKKKSEKILLKTFKNLQKLTIKQSKKITKLALMFSTPIFKIHKIINKKKKYIKEIPTVVINEKARISLAIKLTLTNINNNNKYNSIYKNLYKEILLNAMNQGLTVKKKSQLQKQVLLLKKHFFFFYRWK